MSAHRKALTEAEARKLKDRLRKRKAYALKTELPWKEKKVPTIIGLDYESFYDRDFSLSKMSIDAYVRDPRFEVIGASLKVGDDKAVFVPGPDAVRNVITSIDFSDAIVVCQNTMFDAFITTQYYGVKPKIWADTLCMSRALFPHEKSHSLQAQADRAGMPPKGDYVHNMMGRRFASLSKDELAAYGEYCKHDTELTVALFNRYLGMGFPLGELRLIDMTLRMFTEPVFELNADKLTKHLIDVKAKKLDLLEKVRDSMLRDADADAVHAVFTEGLEGIKKLLMSNDKFAQALRDLGVDPPTKISPTTKKEAWAFAKTDEAFKALQEHPDPDVQALVEARLGNKTTLEETRTEKFITAASRGSFPVPLRYYGAHSGRWSGDQGVNLQNLPSRGPYAKRIKSAIEAPEGHLVIDCDSSQIEARVLAWLAGQEDLVQAFRDKQDVYKLMAAKIYGIPPEQVTEGPGSQRQVGKTVALGCGYGVGHVKLQAFLKLQAGVEVSLAEAKRIIDAYRTSSYRIAEFWRRGQDALFHLADGSEYQVDAVGIIKTVPGKGLTLPSGLFIQYPELQRRVNPEDEKPEWIYFSKGLPVRVYGGKCLAADTEVLTQRGWVVITNVQPDDRLWDGVTWVSHMGLTYQGMKSTVVLDGVRMTTDHLVLTTDGWVNASSCEGLHRADLRMPDGNEVCGRRAPLHLGVPMPVRQSGDANSDRCGEVREAWGQPVMRVCGREGVADTRAFGPPGILGVEVYAGSMSAAVASGMAQLRRAWNQGVPAVGAVVRGFLGGHGAYIPAGADVGPQGQQWRLHPRELPMGVVQSAGWEPPGVAASGHDAGYAADGNSAINAAVSVAPEPVYDIVNAGPRTRFVVRGATGPMIVHNCVENICQAVARQVVAEQMLRINKRYQVRLTVHDSVAVVVPESEAVEAKAFVEECMSWNPKWATGLPLACEAGMGKSYGDC